MMNPEMKAKWVAALRGGNYKQGYGVLRHTSDEFCCLGVLCDLVDPTKWRPGSDLSGASLQGPYHAWNGCATQLPSEISIEFNVDLLEIKTLMGLNDHGTPFATIADYIEKTL